MQQTSIEILEELISKLFPNDKYNGRQNSLKVEIESNSLIIVDLQDQMYLKWLYSINKSIDSDNWSCLLSVLINNYQIEISDSKNKYLLTFDQKNELNLQNLIFSINKESAVSYHNYLKISNLGQDIINEIKSNLVIANEWDYSFSPTKKGQLLISNSLIHGLIYVNGIKFQSLINRNYFAFSYNLFTDSNNLNEEQIIDYIINILSNTENEIIYSILLEHLECYEWQISIIKEFLINEIFKIGIKKCLIYDQNNYQKLAYDLALKQNYYLFACNFSEFIKLKEKNVMTLNDFILNYFYENFQTEIQINKLEPIQSKNYCRLVNLFTILVKFNDIFKTQIKIVDNLPISPLYVKGHKLVLIDSNQLLDMTNLLSTIFNEIFITQKNNYSLQQFSYYWFKAINELDDSENKKISGDSLKLQNIKSHTNITTEQITTKDNTELHDDKPIYLSSNESLQNITHQHPKIFCIENMIFQIKSWKDIYKNTCAYLYGKYKEQFIDYLKNKTNATIINHKENLYEEIGNSNFFIYLNVNGYELVKRSIKLLSYYNIPLDQCYYVLREKE